MREREREKEGGREGRKEGEGGSERECSHFSLCVCVSVFVHTFTHSLVSFTLSLTHTQLSETLQDIEKGQVAKAGGLKKDEESSTEAFIKIMTNFHAGARAELNEVKAKMTLMDQRFESLAKYFGEDVKQFRPGPFFENVHAFCQQFETALEEMRTIQKTGTAGIAASSVLLPQQAGAKDS